MIIDKKDMERVLDLLKDSNSMQLTAIIKICQSQIEMNKIYEEWVINDVHKK